MNKLNCAVLAAILTCLVCLSCKNEDKGTRLESEGSLKNDKPKSENFLGIDIIVKYEQDDNFELFYITSDDEKFSGDQMRRESVVGSKDFQSIKFEISKDDYPLVLKLDPSTNPNQSSVTIQELTLSYGNRSYKIKGNELNKYFSFNAGIEINPSDSTTLKLQPIKIEDNMKYDPFMIGNVRLKEVLTTKL